MIKGILGSLDHKTEEHCPVSTEDTDRNGHQQTGYVTVKPISVQPIEDVKTLHQLNIPKPEILNCFEVLLYSLPARHNIAVTS